MHNVILSDPLIRQLMESLGIGPNAKVRRVIIDCQMREAVVAYVEFLGDTQMLEIDFSDLSGANIMFAPKEPEDNR